MLSNFVGVCPVDFNGAPDVSVGVSPDQIVIDGISASDPDVGTIHGGGRYAMLPPTHLPLRVAVTLSIMIMIISATNVVLGRRMLAGEDIALTIGFTAPHTGKYL